MEQFESNFGVEDVFVHPPLYCRDKRGKIRVFYCNVYQKSDKKGLIVTKTGGLGSKLVTKQHNVVKGKNISKANATTPVEQAVLEAAAMWTKKLKEGYKGIEQLAEFIKPYDETVYSKQDNGLIPYLNEYLPRFNTDNNNRMKPMLADKWKKKNAYPAFLQPKYNGVRCLSFIENEKIITLSREGTEYDVMHINSGLKSLFHILYTMGVDNAHVDGELYSHGKALQDIVSLVKSPSIFSSELTYQVYDIAIPDTSQADRYVLLKQAFKHLDELGITASIVMAPTLYVYSEEEVIEKHAKNLSNGFEGSILRPFSGKYMFGFRDAALQKIKTTISDEVLILGGDLAAGAPDEDFTWHCQTKEGKTFNVKPHGTIAQRREWFNDKFSFIGKWLQISFFEYTKDGIPFHITEVTVRDYE